MNKLKIKIVHSNKHIMKFKSLSLFIITFIAPNSLLLLKTTKPLNVNTQKEQTNNAVKPLKQKMLFTKEIAIATAATICGFALFFYKAQKRLKPPIQPCGDKAEITTTCSTPKSILKKAIPRTKYKKNVTFENNVKDNTGKPKPKKNKQRPTFSTKATCNRPGETTASGFMYSSASLKKMS